MARRATATIAHAHGSHLEVCFQPQTTISTRDLVGGAQDNLRFGGSHRALRFRRPGGSARIRPGLGRTGLTRFGGLAVKGVLIRRDAARHDASQGNRAKPSQHVTPPQGQPASTSRRKVGEPTASARMRPSISSPAIHLFVAEIRTAHAKASDQQIISLSS